MSRCRTKAFQLSAWQLLTQSKLLAAVRSLELNSHVRSVAFGRSAGGNLIPCLVLGAEPVSAGTEAANHPTILLTGGTFGTEAAETEALLEVVQLIVGSDEYLGLLEHLTVVVVPCVNPDGRSRAIECWRKYPLSPAMKAQCNSSDVLLNRDFFYLSQPETRWVHEVFNAYRPDVVLDMHEDVYGLGVTMEETCWCPPFRGPVHPLVSPEVLEGIAVLGADIAQAWRGRGYNCLYDPSGERGLLSLARHGRMHLDFCLHNAIALITESARTPGAISWEERVNQKVVAALAVMKSMIEHEHILSQLVQRAGGYQRPASAYVVPKNNRTEAVHCLLRTLRWHGIGFEEISAPVAGFAIQNQQSGDKVIRMLMDDDLSCDSLPRFLGLKGVRSVPSEQLIPDRPFLGVHCSNPRTVGRWTSLELPGACDRLWTDPLQHGVPMSSNEVPRVTTPRIALYMGVGVTEHHVESLGWMKQALEKRGLPYAVVSQGDVLEGVLEEFDLFAVTGGDANEILKGPDPSNPLRRSPWKPDPAGACLGMTGIERIRLFLAGGGVYLGVGAGGGSLLCRPYGGILDIDEIDHSRTNGRARLSMRVSEHPLLTGVRSDDCGDDGPWVAYYSSPETRGKGAPVFCVGEKAQVLADLDLSAFQPDGDSTAGRSSASSATCPAIIVQAIGEGVAVILAFEPGFRGIAERSSLLIANAASLAAERGRR